MVLKRVDEIESLILASKREVSATKAVLLKSTELEIRVSSVKTNQNHRDSVIQVHWAFEPVVVEEILNLFLFVDVSLLVFEKRKRKAILNVVFVLNFVMECRLELELYHR